ncbi:hypothetical protein [Flavobacterium sp.]|uniref:hypothetical protein n=1 Tax=Flavobacterium sp. TaxID=239 RepID=UPI003D6B1DFA
MKKTILYVFALTVFALGQVFGQSTTEQNLNSGIQSAEKIKQGVVAADKAVNQLVKEISVIGNPNAVLFNDKMYEQVASVQNNSDDVLYFMDLAKNASATPFSTQEIDVLTSDLVSLNDDLMYLTSQIIDVLDHNNPNAALTYVPQVRNVLTAQNDKAAQVIVKIELLKQVVKQYDVCIQTVDYLGNPVSGSDLHGFYAQNLATGEYIYPTNQDGNCFDNLPAGTYLFDSYNGYWSGTSSEEVTLSDGLVNSNGVIIVNLVYWSE